MMIQEGINSINPSVRYNSVDFNASPGNLPLLDYKEQSQDIQKG